MASKHSPIGASHAERWMNCPASVRLCESAPTPPQSKYAAEGTMAHEVAEKMLRGMEAWELIDGDATSEMIDGAELYVKYIRSITRPENVVYIEQHLSLTNYDKRAFGTADCVVSGWPTLTVVDYKFGAGYAVEVEDNPQLRFYALGALFGLKAAVRKQVETVRMAIVQPRAPHDHGPVRQTEMAKSDLLKWGKTVLRPAMERTKHYDAPTVPGKWCRWCPAITLCPEQGKLPVKVAAEVDFSEKPMSALPVVRGLTPEQIGIALEAQSSIEAWFAQVAAEAKMLLDKGTPVPGYKLVKGRTSRSWLDETKVEPFLKKHLGEKAFSMKLISPAQATKLLDVPSSYIVESQSPPTIAPVADRRQGVSRSLITDFKE